MNDSSDGVWLWHPSKPASHPDLVLHPEGDVSSAEPDEFFFADGPERWAAFLDTVPRPNWWERGQAARDKFVGTVMIPVVLPVALVFLCRAADVGLLTRLRTDRNRSVVLAKVRPE